MSGKACEVILYPEDGWTVDKIVSCISERKSVRVYAIILHDKDIDAEGNAKKPHYHAYLSFGSTNVAFQNVAAWFDTGENSVERIKAKGKNSRYDYLVYQLHTKQPNKYQYQISDITANFDVSEYLRKHEQEINLDTILDQIENGTITRLNYTDYIDIRTYATHKQKIDRAFEYRDAAQASKSFGERSISVFWIAGSSKTGKTTLVKLFAKSQQEPLYITDEGDHPFDGYTAQRIICIDEIRPNSPFTFQELLQILDNHTSHTVAARYHNKTPYFDMAFITSIYTPEQFFSGCQEPYEEAVQLYRRITELWLVTAETIFIKKYNFDKGMFLEVAKRKNPVPAYIESIRRPPALSGSSILRDLELRYTDEQLTIDDACGDNQEMDADNPGDASSTKQ